MTNNNGIRQQRFMQNFVLMSLGVDISQGESLNPCDSIKELYHYINNIHIFTVPDELLEFISQTQHDKVLLILSNIYAKALVPVIHDMAQIYVIYIFTDDELTKDEWTKQWSKIGIISNDMDKICRMVHSTAWQCDRDAIQMSVISTDDISSMLQIKDLNQLEPSFMYTQLFKEVFLEISYNDTVAIKEFIAHALEQATNNPTLQERLAKFDNDFHNHTAIWWYTYESILYSMLNRALRIFEMDTLLKMGFFISHLHRQIQSLYQEQICENRGSFMVYRGQGLVKEDFERLRQCENGLVSFNNFLSTSINRDVSFIFADSNRYNPNLVGVLFEIAVDYSISTAPFAKVGHISHYGEEQEVLFSMHSVFRIGQVSQIDGDPRLWQVNLVLTSDTDPILTELAIFLQKETSGSTGWHRLGQLLVKAGKVDKVEEVYQALLDQSKVDSERAPLLYHLGYAKKNQGKFNEAISFYREAIEIYEKLSTSHSALPLSYNNIGLVYMNLCDYSKALLYHEKALTLCQLTHSSDDPLLATVLSNIGLTYNKIGNHVKALSFYEKALSINEKRLPSYHPDLGSFYNNIAGLYHGVGDYGKALSFYEKTLDIYQRTLPSKHPYLATAYNNIGVIHKHMGNLNKALDFYKKALEIRQEILTPNHPDLARSFDNIGCIYKNLNNYSEAFIFYRKALDIRQANLPPYHSDLSTSYNNIAVAYSSINEYVAALSYFEKALEIDRKNLSPNHFLFVTSYNNIGTVYNSIGQYTQSILFHEKAIEVCQKALPADHPHLAGCYYNIGGVYMNMGDYKQAVSWCEKAVAIFKQKLPENHPTITICQERLYAARKKLLEE